MKKKEEKIMWNRSGSISRGMSSKRCLNHRSWPMELACLGSKTGSATPSTRSLGPLVQKEQDISDSGTEKFGEGSGRQQ